MHCAIAVLSTAIVILLILIWLRAGRRKRCRDCRHFAEQYITGLAGKGLFRFGYCQRLIHDCRVVEPDVERECRDYEEKPSVKTEYKI